VVPCSPSLDQLGFFTQDVAGARLAASVLCDGWRQQSVAGDRLPILGIPDGPYLQQASPDALAAFDAQLTRLTAAGYDVRRVPAFADIKEIDKRHRALMFGEMAQVHAAWFAQHEPLYAPKTAALIRFGQTVSSEQIDDGRRSRQALRAELEALMNLHGIDLWVSPAATGAAPAGIESTGDPAMNLPWTHAGLPVATVPSGLSVDGLPYGLQLAGRWGADEELLTWAERIALAVSSESA
jgi:Asp-tRNA(Asn)/Glu-tRNA(Gln) amidotransferase A subunit family amidase